MLTTIRDGVSEARRGGLPVGRSGGWLCIGAAVVFCGLGFAVVARAAELRVGFGQTEITPQLAEDRPVWLAGYGTGRRATGVHDPLMARCVVLDDGARRIALVSVDLVGLQYPAVLKIREALPECDYVLVASTHNHEGPDVIGIWGKSLLRRGVDERYVAKVVDRVAKLVRQVSRRTTPARGAFGTAEDESLVHDSRLPIVKDGILRVVRFESVDGKRLRGLVVQWSAHPEALGSRNTEITADFPAATVAALRERYDCPVVYFSGAVGGLMAPPREGIRDADGRPLQEGQFAFAESYGRQVAELAIRAEQNARPLELRPLRASARAIVVPVSNPYYRTAQAFGVLRRQGYLWTGDFNKPGAAVPLNTTEGETGILTEVACVRLGDLHIGAIPGEIYPELVYGKIQEPVEPAVDFPQAEKEPAVTDILPGDRWLLLGLANDEIGYIIPRRQWDQLPPFAYGRSSAQYGEVNSCGPRVAPIVMEALRQAVEGTRD